MAQLKDRAEPEDFLVRMRREEREFNEKHPILDTRYYVEEWQSFPHLVIDDRGTPPQPRRINRFGPFNRQEFDDWMEKHVPDKDCHFVPRVENLRHYSYDKWGR